MPMESTTNESTRLPARAPESELPPLELVKLDKPSMAPASSVLNVINSAIESPALRDGLKLIVIGGVLEAARRGFTLVCRSVVECEQRQDHSIRC